MKRRPAISGAPRALMLALLQQHSVDDAFALLQRTVIGADIRLDQVKAAARRAITGLTCSDCPKPITKQSKTGRCLSCATKVRRSDPELDARRLAKMREKFASPEHRATMKAARARVEAERKNDPAWQAYKRASGKRLRADYDASEEGQRKNAAKRALVGQKTSARRLAHIPAAYRDEYRGLVKCMPAAEAAAIIAEQVARDSKRPVRAPLSFEEQLARVARGEARVIEKPVFRKVDHAFTLGGVATGML